MSKVISEILVFSFLLFYYPLFATPKDDSLSIRGKIIERFHFGIMLNENLKASISTNKYIEARIEVEKYFENQMQDAIWTCVSIISHNNDTTLGKEFFKLLMSFENSADENLSYAIGEIFFWNSDFISYLLTTIPNPYRLKIIDKIEFGFKNYLNIIDSNKKKRESINRIMELKRRNK
ncbi:MAG: hypothetical protein HY960_05955 [Ignavibacteriae bacterium]|nr:hypothetical protein [Ignavibacteriota bacterium]